MEKFKVSFIANNQQLTATGTKHASDTYADIEATFALGERWTDMDSVSAVWWNDFTRITTVLDSEGKCTVPHEVLMRKGCVRVNLVGSVVENGELVTRLTSYSAEAVHVNEKIKLTGNETSEITPSQYEQFVENVKADADRAESAKESAQDASASASSASESATLAEQAKQSARASAQNAQISAQTAENAKDDAESARDEILGMSAEAVTLPAGSEATASYADGLLSLGIPRGNTGATGAKGDTGETGATPNLTIGNVETLEPTESATATITGTAENPVLNLGIPQGDTGDVSQEQLDAAVSDLKSDKADNRLVGFNQWDEVWEVGGIANGADNNYVTNSIRSKNYIPVDVTKKYYFKATVNMWVHCYDSSKTFLSMLNSRSSFKNLTFALPANTAYIRFAMNSYGTTYNYDICINIDQPNTSVFPYNGIYKSYASFDSLFNRVLQDESDEITYRSQMTTYKNVTKAISSFAGVEKFTGYNSSASATEIGVGALTAMDSYMLFVKDASFYFPDEVITKYASAGYLAICKIENANRVSTYQIYGTSGARYRNTESNLPSSSNPIVLSGESAIIVTLDTGTDVSIVSNGVVRTLSDYVLLGQQQIDQIETNNEKGKVEFSGSVFTFNMGNHKLYIEHEVDNDIRQNTWRLKRGSIVHNDVESDMWNGSDADGVVRLASENDFLGGYHGDEITTAVSVFIDGESVGTSTAFLEREFKTFVMFVTSNVYHCIDSADSANVAFVRHKIISVDKSGVSISNHWVASESVNVTTAYMGMLSVAKSLVTNYSMNSDDAVVDNTTQVAGASYCDKVIMLLNTGNIIEYSMSDRSAQVPYGYGEIYNGVGVSNRVKAYFAEIYKLDGLYLTLNQGDIIRATSTMCIK